MFSASPAYQEHLRGVAHRVFATPPREPGQSGLLSKLGPIFRRAPQALVLSPEQPEPADLDVLLNGAYVPPQRTRQTWRLLESLVDEMSWGTTTLRLDNHDLDDLDFALARGGVHAAFGLRQLVANSTSVNLQPASGLTVGWHPHHRACEMAAAYREAMPSIKTDWQRDMIRSLTSWLDGFPAWSEVARSMNRPTPDLIGFWASSPSG